MMHDDLFALQQKVAKKPLLESKLYELHTQRRQYDNQVISLRVAFRKEQEDVEKLEGRSLANYFYQVIGKLDDKLDQERKEAYAARVKLDAAERELAGIESDIIKIQEQITDVLVAEARYKDALELKRRQLKDSGTQVADQILSMEERIAALQAQKQEIKEAISAGYSALSTADRILSAQELVQELQSQLRRFKTELADIQISANMQVNIDGFLRFADYFFDGLFADWAVGDKISQSLSSVSNTKSEINRMLDKLNDMEKAVDQKIQQKKTKLEQFVVKA